MSNDEIPYQIAPQVEALQQERANCVAYGNKPRVAAIDRQLAEYGVKARVAEKRAAASGDTGAAPKGRHGQGSEQTQVSAEPAEVPKGNASREEWAAYAKSKGASDEEVGPVEDGGFNRDDLRAQYGAD